MQRRLLGVLVLLFSVLSAGGCMGALPFGVEDYSWVGRRTDTHEVSVRAVRLRWRRQLVPDYEGEYEPVERSVAALDPARDRVYIASSDGRLFAFNSGGGPEYTYDSQSQIAASLTLDAAADELYLPTEDGLLHRLRASTGEVQWRSEIDGAVSQPVVLQDDVIYLVTDSDVVLAVDRSNGEPLWHYRRDPPDGFYVSHHAGLTIDRGRLLTGFSDGVVVALDLRDGALIWERDTMVDLSENNDGPPRFVDVDTSPVVVGDAVYVASFAGGLYALEASSGTVLWREPELTGVTSISAAPQFDLLILSSGDLGVVAFDPGRRRIRWRTGVQRGAPAPSVVMNDLVLVGETQGGFLSLDLRNGRELGRIETGHGVSARASVAFGRGFVLSNGGRFFAFAASGVR